MHYIIRKDLNDSSIVVCIAKHFRFLFSGTPLHLPLYGEKYNGDFNEVMDVGRRGVSK